MIANIGFLAHHNAFIHCPLSYLYKVGCIPDAQFADDQSSTEII